MKKTIISIVVIMLGLIGLILFGRQSIVAGPSGAPSSLTAQEVFHDFGTISMARGTVNHTFTISNPTDKDIVINGLETSCMCTTAYFVNGASKMGPFGMPGMGFMPSINETIKPGETRTIEMVFDPAAHGPAGIGLMDRFAYLTDSNGGTLQLEIKATVTP